MIDDCCQRVYSKETVKKRGKRTSCRYLHEIELLTIDSIIVKNYVRLLNYTWSPPPAAPHRGAGRIRERRKSRMRREQKKASRGEGGTDRRRSTGTILMHKTCIFTKPVFTDVNTRYARGTRERRGRQREGGRREGEKGFRAEKTASRHAIYLFYPGR